MVRVKGRWGSNEVTEFGEGKSVEYFLLISFASPLLQMFSFNLMSTLQEKCYYSRYKLGSGD